MHVFSIDVLGFSQITNERFIEKIGEALGEVGNETERVAENVEAENEHVDLSQSLCFVVLEELVVELVPCFEDVDAAEEAEREYDVFELGDGGADRLHEEVDDCVGGAAAFVGVLVALVRGSVDAAAEIAHDWRDVQVVEADVGRLFDAAAHCMVLHDLFGELLILVDPFDELWILVDEYERDVCIGCRVELFSLVGCFLFKNDYFLALFISEKNLRMFPSASSLSNRTNF